MSQCGQFNIQTIRKLTLWNLLLFSWAFGPGVKDRIDEGNFLWGLSNLFLCFFTILCQVYDFLKLFKHSPMGFIFRMEARGILVYYTCSNIIWSICEFLDNGLGLIWLCMCVEFACLLFHPDWRGMISFPSHCLWNVCLNYKTYTTVINYSVQSNIIQSLHCFIDSYIWSYQILEAKTIIILLFQSHLTQYLNDAAKFLIWIQLIDFFPLLIKRRNNYDYPNDTV